MESNEIFDILGRFEERLEELITLKNTLEDKNRILCDKLDRLEKENLALIEYKERSQEENADMRSRITKLIVRIEETIEMANRTA